MRQKYLIKRWIEYFAKISNIANQQIPPLFFSLYLSLSISLYRSFYLSISIYLSISSGDFECRKIVKNSASMTEIFSFGRNLDPKSVIDTQKNSTIHLSLKRRFLFTPPRFLGDIFPLAFFFKDSDLSLGDFLKNFFHNFERKGDLAVFFLKDGVGPNSFLDPFLVLAVKWFVIFETFQGKIAHIRTSLSSRSKFSRRCN